MVNNALDDFLVPCDLGSIKSLKEFQNSNKFTVFHFVFNCLNSTLSNISFERAEEKFKSAMKEFSKHSILKVFRVCPLCLLPFKPTGMFQHLKTHSESFEEVFPNGSERSNYFTSYFDTFQDKYDFESYPKYLEHFRKVPPESILAIYEKLKKFESFVSPKSSPKSKDSSPNNDSTLDGLNLSVLKSPKDLEAFNTLVKFEEFKRDKPLDLDSLISSFCTDVRNHGNPLGSESDLVVRMQESKLFSDLESSIKQDIMGYFISVRDLIRQGMTTSE